MSDITIYHNPRCSKSRQTLALIEDAGIAPTVVEYLKTPPSATQLGGLVDQLGVAVTDIIRFKEALASELGVGKADDRSRDEWLQLLADNPKLIERPIVTRGGRAVMGRPPENVQALL